MQCSPSPFRMQPNLLYEGYTTASGFRPSPSGPSRAGSATGLVFSSREGARARRQYWVCLILYNVCGTYLYIDPVHAYICLFFFSSHSCALNTFTPQTTMVKPILLAAAFSGVCAVASPLVKKDSGNNGNSDGPCFNATIRKEFLLQITTYQPYDPYDSDVNNVEQVRLNIADPTNQNQRAISCTDFRWNSTNQPFPSDYLTCSDPTISYKLTSYTDNRTFSLIINQTFVQGSFSKTVLASYNATPSDLNGYGCWAKGCGAHYQNVRSRSFYITFGQATYTFIGRPRARDCVRCPEERSTIHNLP